MFKKVVFWFIAFSNFYFVLDFYHSRFKSSLPSIEEIEAELGTTDIQKIHKKITF